MYIILGIVFFFVVLYILYLFDIFSSEADAKKNIVYPPWINSCPDYWKHTKDGDGNMICEKDSNNPTGRSYCEGYYGDDNNLGLGKFALADLSKEELKTMSTACNLPWEGINDP